MRDKTVKLWLLMSLRGIGVHAWCPIRVGGFWAGQRFYINFPFESSKHRSIFLFLGHRNFFVSSRFRCINKCSSVSVFLRRLSSKNGEKISLQTTRDAKTCFCFKIYVFFFCYGRKAENSEHKLTYTHVMGTPSEIVR